ncbi:MAG: twin-arginine translocation pathway signal [Alphaproteobacteria bacterium]|nr:twin-arginine translocation pathway signal [Alphaproteobacteria bacterium]
MKQMWHGFGMVILALACLLAGAPDAAAASITVKSSHHILDGDDPGRKEFGRLIYLSGIEMTSDNHDFGGLSGLQISEDGVRLLAVTDTGKWLSANLVTEKDRLKGLDHVELSTLHDENGQELKDKTEGDAESLTLKQRGNIEGPAYVSFEGRHRVLFYPEGLGAKATSVAMPGGLMLASPNKGLEAFDRRADGAFVALTEHFLNAEGNHTGWLIDGQKMNPLSLRRDGEFEPIDLEFLPDGDLLVLERRYSVAGGPGMQIRLVHADQIKPGALLDGEVLINLTSRYGIDNFEGIAARKNAAGETIIYVVSDNNFNILQKNLLLMFKLEPD